MEWDKVDIFTFASSNLEGQITSWGLRTVGVSAIVLIVLIIIASQTKDRFPITKLPLFIAMATTVVGSTIFLIGSTVYLNVVSDSGGPVHWHADIEYWACGSEVELRDPFQFLSNKIGSPVLHEHDDKRIHLEGVVVDLDEDATIGNFMSTIGGSLEQNRIVIPIHDERIEEDDVDGDEVDASNLSQLNDYVGAAEDGSRILDLQNGQLCGTQPAELQVFVYQFNEDDDTYQQYKLEPGVTLPQQDVAGDYNPTTLASAADYIYSDNPNVPPGDCVIFEFDTPREFTNRLCNQYGLKDSVRCTEFGLSEFNAQQCDITDVTDYTSSTALTTNSNTYESQASYCSAYYDSEGNPTGVEIATFKDDGGLVVPAEDCNTYQEVLRCEHNVALGEDLDCEAIKLGEEA